jgi:hypothetical protein
LKELGSDAVVMGTAGPYMIVRFRHLSGSNPDGSSPGDEFFIFRDGVEVVDEEFDPNGKAERTSFYDGSKSHRSWATLSKPKPDSTYANRKFFCYDADGNITRMDEDMDGDGTIDRRMNMNWKMKSSSVEVRLTDRWATVHYVDGRDGLFCLDGAGKLCKVEFSGGCWQFTGEPLPPDTKDKVQGASP